MTKRSPAQRLAREIQAATGKPYLTCLGEAEAILETIGENDAMECGDELTRWTCSLRPGPHPGWRHVDDESGVWWSQSREFPYSSAAEKP